MKTKLFLTNKLCDRKIEFLKSFWDNKLIIKINSDNNLNEDSSKWWVHGSYRLIKNVELTNCYRRENKIWM